MLRYRSGVICLVRGGNNIAIFELSRSIKMLLMMGWTGKPEAKQVSYLFRLSMLLRGRYVQLVRSRKRKTGFNLMQCRWNVKNAMSCVFNLF